MVNGEFSYSVFHFERPEWSPQDAWKVRDKFPGYPHVMFTMKHDLLGDDEKLLRGEVLAILAIMASRLEAPDLKDHLIIPVSLRLRFIIIVSHIHI